MPRIRNWKDYRFYRPDAKVRYDHIDAIFKERIDWALIERHWKDLMQVVISIRDGRIAASTLLRKLGSASRKNRLYHAFKELGAAVRTLFLLRYISDLQLREQITAPRTRSKPSMGFPSTCSSAARASLLAMTRSNRKRRSSTTTSSQTP